MNNLKIIETPRDGIQGIQKFIPTQTKIEFVNTLLEAGFESLEVGSFVSSKAIPQLKDTGEVINMLQLQNASSKIIVLAGNEKRGSNRSTISSNRPGDFSVSVSESFLQRNINTDFKKGWDRLINMHEILKNANKELVPYLTMGLGNPYGDEWSIDIVLDWVGKLINAGIKNYTLIRHNRRSQSG